MVILAHDSHERIWPLAGLQLRSLRLHRRCLWLWTASIFAQRTGANACGLFFVPDATKGAWLCGPDFGARWFLASRRLAYWMSRLHGDRKWSSIGCVTLSRPTSLVLLFDQKTLPTFSTTIAAAMLAVAASAVPSHSVRRLHRGWRRRTCTALVQCMTMMVLHRLPMFTTLVGAGLSGCWSWFTSSNRSCLFRAIIVTRIQDRTSSPRTMGAHKDLTTITCVLTLLIVRSIRRESVTVATPITLRAVPLLDRESRRVLLG